MNDIRTESVGESTGAAVGVPVTGAESRAEYWRQLLIAAKPFIEQAGVINGYGFYRPENPNDFFPDHESCTDEEAQAHKAACEAHNRGEFTPDKSDGWVAPNMHILTAPWGIGSYSEVIPEAAELLAAIAAATGAE